MFYLFALLTSTGSPYDYPSPSFRIKALINDTVTIVYLLLPSLFDTVPMMIEFFNMHNFDFLPAFHHVTSLFYKIK